MRITILYTILLCMLAVGIASNASEIVIQDADSTWESQQEEPLGIPPVPPRVIVDEVNSLYRNALTDEIPDLPIGPRFIIRNANSAYHSSLINDLPSLPMEPRVVVQYANSLPGWELVPAICIQVDPESWDYGDVEFGSYSDKTIVVTNPCFVSLDVREVTITGPDTGDFKILSGGDPFTLNVDETHDIVVRFEPTSEGSKSAALTIANNVPGEDPLLIPLCGNSISWFITFTATSECPELVPVDGILGADPYAENGYDPRDVPLPPLGMPPYLDVSFEGEPPFDRLAEDYRQEVAHDVFDQTWFLHVKTENDSGCGFTLCWDMSHFAEDSLKAYISQIEPPVPGYLDMSTQACLPGPFAEGIDYKFAIRIAPVVYMDIQLFAGWNMISWPGEPDTPEVAKLVADTPILPFFYTWGDGSYVLPNTVQLGLGYWVASTVDYTFTIWYRACYLLDTPIRSGWSMVGSLDCVLPVSSLTSNPNCHLPSVYAWDPVARAYTTMDDMAAGAGHWVAAICDCVLTMDCSAPLVESQPVVDAGEPTWKSVVNVENQELVFGMHPSASDGFDRLLDKPLPPPPVAPSDEVKERGGKHVTDILKAAWIIQGADFPRLCESYVKEGSQGKWELSIELPRPGKIEWSNLPEGYSCILHYDKRSIDMNSKKFLPLPAGEYNLTLVLDALDSLPKKTQLLANYPNPFNPETWIPYELKEDNDVTIRIYTATGQLVRVLNLGHRPAGFYTTKAKAAYWDGKNEAGEAVASGIYFYTIQAGGFTATKKMVIAR